MLGWRGKTGCSLYSIYISDLFQKCLLLHYPTLKKGIVFLYSISSISFILLPFLFSTQLAKYYNLSKDIFLDNLVPRFSLLPLSLSRSIGTRDAGKTLGMRNIPRVGTPSELNFQKKNAVHKSYLFTIYKKISEILVGNFCSVRTVRVVYHLPKIFGLLCHARLDSSYNM